MAESLLHSVVLTKIRVVLMNEGRRVLSGLARIFFNNNCIFGPINWNCQWVGIEFGLHETAYVKIRIQ